MPGRDDLRRRAGIAEFHYRISQEIGFLEDAIAALGELVQGAEPGTAQAEDLNLLGGLLWERFERTGDLADLDRCIETMRRLSETTPPDSELYPSLLQNLGLALETRFRRLLRAEDLDESIGRHREAVERGKRRGHVKLIWINNLANALRLRSHFDRRVADLEEAIRLHESVLAQTPPDAPDYPAHAANLGSDLLDLYSWELERRDPRLLKTARSLLQLAVSRPGGEPADIVRFQAHLARALEETALITRPDPELSESVTASFQAAVLGGRTIHPETAMRSAVNWGNWAFAHRHWEDAAGAFQEALEIAGSLFALAVDRDRKQAWLRETQGSAERAAYALAELGRPEEAVMLLERSRTRILSESFAKKGGASPPAGPLGFKDVFPATVGGAVLYLCSTFHGGVGLFVHRDGQSRVSAYPLPKLSESFLESHLRYFFGAYASRQSQAEVWLQALDDVTRKLWSAVIEPLASELESAPHATLIPVGRVALLPLHAAWKKEPSQRSGRIYALDRVSLSYAPNARALSAGSAPAFDRSSCLLAVADPALPGAMSEARSVALEFARSMVLAGEQATKARILEEIARYDVLHFSCHARANLFEPLQSAVILPDGTFLRLADLLEVSSGEVGLAVFAACEAGTQGLNLPDEAISLSSGLLETGIPCVVESRWAVEDRSTALLMIHFYHLWRQEGIFPTRALQQAQQWLRDSSRDEKLALLQSYPETSIDAEARRTLTDFLAKSSEHQVDFRHPFFWAGFQWTGRVAA